MYASNRSRDRALALTMAAAVALSACGPGSATSDGGSPEVSITAPAEGASVGSSFEVTWDANVDLGEPDTGKEHVHVFVDGASNDYTVVGGNSFTVAGLAPGEHTVNVTLQHSDHSSAGAEDSVDVLVVEDGQPTSPPPSTEPPSDPYDY